MIIRTWKAEVGGEVILRVRAGDGHCGGFWMRPPKLPIEIHQNNIDILKRKVKRDQRGAEGGEGLTSSFERHRGDVSPISYEADCVIPWRSGGGPNEIERKYY